MQVQDHSIVLKVVVAVSFCFWIVGYVVVRRLFWRLIPFRQVLSPGPDADKTIVRGVGRLASIVGPMFLVSGALAITIGVLSANTLFIIPGAVTICFGLYLVLIAMKLNRKLRGS